MTVSSEQSYIEYNGDGVTKTFTIPFYFILGSDISITLTDSNGTETQLINGTDYSVVGDGSSSGGAATLNVAPASGIEVTIYRNPPVTQETAYYENGKFPAKSHEKALDKLTMLIQTALYRLNIYNSKAIKVPESGNWVAPKIADRKNKIFAWNDSGYPIAVLPPDGSASDVMIELAKPTGAGLIGTNHRGTLASDLNAIDRRPDGYGNSIPAVLANGLDVQIGKDMSITVPVAVLSNQHIEGAGGNISQTTSTAAGVRVESADASNTKNYVTINNLRTTGSTVTTEPGNEGYALFLRNTKYNRISGVLADKYTGGVVAGSSKSLIVRDVITHDTTFHPFSSSTRDGRGGYGVITDNISDSIIDGIVHDVGAVDDGRHILYVSTGGYGNTSGNRNFIAANLIGKYLGKDDRNFWGVNVRKSTIFVIGQTVIDGANGGVAFNAENGDITDFIVHGQQLDIIKYQDGIGVYGISLPKDAANVGARFLVSNFNIRVRPKNTSLTGADCVAISVGYQNGMITNGLTNVPAGSSPILINDGATNTTFSNIHDTILPGYTGSTVAMFAFTGSAVSNITVKNITTTRPMFTRLSVVTDLTVDFQRKARISTNGSGGSSKIDSNEIISTVSLTSSAITVNFPTHVTQNAIENVYVAGTAGAYQVFITSIGAKAITISLYTPAGALINPLTSSASFNVILSS